MAVKQAVDSVGPSSHGGIVDAASLLADAMSRLAEAEDTLRAIGAGEIDALVVNDEKNVQRVFTLSTADRPYRIFVENMRDGAATLSASGVILYANRRLAELLDCSRETLLGSPLAGYVTADMADKLMEIPGPDGLGAAIEVDLIDAQGAAVPVLVGASPFDADGDQVTCLTFTDLSAQRAQDREIARLSEAQAERMADLQIAQAALTKQATHDALTGLPNRDLLVDRIDQALLQAERSDGWTAVFFVDLDRFKQVNDTHGHSVGNAVLRTVAGRLVGALRSMDTVARIGGDEFVVLAPAIDSHLHALDMGTRLVNHLQRQFDGLNNRHVSASVGIAVSKGGRGTAETLLHEADMAMYQAKSLGGGRCEAFDAGLARLVQERGAAQHTLQLALDERRVVAYYQPIVNLSTGTVAGFEALARIVEHDGSVLHPAHFISVAEESGLVVPLGGQVLELACQQTRRWQLGGQQDAELSVAVNMSPRQFEAGDLSRTLKSALGDSSLDPRRLHLELTETAIMDLRPDILKQLAEIRELGVQVGLDDFGTGYASLTHLRRLPLNFVKIDQTFVQGLGVDDNDNRIVAAVIDLAANLGMRSIAEGVETQDQLDHLSMLGCDQAQGYFFARPAAPDDNPQVPQVHHELSS
jgi:diguanylate cyclase (GGDEF)-like protein